VAYGLLLLRVFVGVAFFGHGTQKLFGWWGGFGPQGTGGFFASQGYRWGVPMAVLAGLAEAGGGTLLALGLLTPLACAAIAVVMLNAIFAVTLKRAFMAGSELELTYLVTAVALAAIGPGRFSLDRAIGWDDDLSGVWYGIGAFVVAALVSFVTLAMLRTKPPSQPAAEVE
jgi:putative oxidoreductase